MPINYLRGDLFQSNLSNKIILHCCNDIGAWGKGFVVPLGSKFPLAKQKYKEIGRTGKYSLGDVQFVLVDEVNNTWVGNMIGQSGIYTQHGKPPIRYGAIEDCLKLAYKFCIEHGLSTIMPKFGAGLAGGDWEKIEEMIEANLPLGATVFCF